MNSLIEKKFIPDGELCYCHNPEKGITLCYTNILLFIKEHVGMDLPENFRSEGPHYFSEDDFKEEFLNKGEIERVNNHKTLKKQVEWICGRYSAKIALQALLQENSDLTELSIEYREEGAPYFSDYNGFILSISHSGNFAVAAIADLSIKGLGVDVERMRDLDVQAFSRIAFTERERNSLKGAPLEEILRRFTLKEAYLKYIGKGFNESLSSIEEIDNSLYFKKELLENVEFTSYFFSPEYLISILYTR